MKLVVLLLLFVVFFSFSEASVEQAIELRYKLDNDYLLVALATKINLIPELMDTHYLLDQSQITNAEWNGYFGYPKYENKWEEIIKIMNRMLRRIATSDYDALNKQVRGPFKLLAYGIMARVYFLQANYYGSLIPVGTEYQEFVARTISNYAPTGDFELSGDDAPEAVDDEENDFNTDHDLGVQLAILNEAIGVINIMALRLIGGIGIEEQLFDMENLRLATNLIMTMDMILLGSSGQPNSANFGNVYETYGINGVFEKFLSIPRAELQTLKQYVQDMVDGPLFIETPQTKQRWANFQVYGVVTKERDWRYANIMDYEMQ